MFEVSQIIAKALKEDTAVSDIVGEKVFPLIADQDLQHPYIVYNVQEIRDLTKDGAKEYQVTILSYEKKYDDALLLDTAVLNVMTAIHGTEFNGKKYKFTNEGAEPLLDENYKVYVKRILNLKK